MIRQTDPSRHDAWSGGAAYVKFMGRWSLEVAPEFVRWLAVPRGADGSTWVAGRGALSRVILEQADPAAVKGIDLSPAYVAYARTEVTDPRASFEVGDAQALPVDVGAYDAVVSALMLNFLPQPDKAVASAKRAVKPGGVVAGYVWDYSDKMQMLHLFWEAAVAFDPAAASLHESIRFPLCKSEPLTQLFQGAGLANVEVNGITVPTTFKDFDNYWLPFLGGQGPASGYITSLSEEKRETLRERVRAFLPIASDGSIPLTARAWAVRGTAEGNAP